MKLSRTAKILGTKKDDNKYYCLASYKERQGSEEKTGVFIFQEGLETFTLCGSQHKWDKLAGQSFPMFEMLNRVIPLEVYFDECIKDSGGETAIWYKHENNILPPGFKDISSYGAEYLTVARI